jgi:predicted kinase
MRKRVFNAEQVIINGVKLGPAPVKFRPDKMICIGDIGGSQKIHMGNYARATQGQNVLQTFQIDDYKGTFTKYETGWSTVHIEDPNLERDLPTLKLTAIMGVQASGKTTISNEFLAESPTTQYVCSDLYWPVDQQGQRYWTDDSGARKCWYSDPLPSELKERAYSWSHRKMLAYMDAGDDILFEGTLVDKHTRNNLLYDAWMSGYEVHGIFLLPSLLVCASRNSKRAHPVPDVALARTYAKVEVPTKDEGFASLEIIRMEK